MQKINEILNTVFPKYITPIIMSYITPPSNRLKHIVKYGCIEQILNDERFTSDEMLYYICKFGRDNILDEYYTRRNNSGIPYDYVYGFYGSCCSGNLDFISTHLLKDGIMYSIDHIYTGIYYAAKHKQYTIIDYLTTFLYSNKKSFTPSEGGEEGEADGGKGYYIVSDVQIYNNICIGSCIANDMSTLCTTLSKAKAKYTKRELQDIICTILCYSCTHAHQNIAEYILDTFCHTNSENSELIYWCASSGNLEFVNNMITKYITRLKNPKYKKEYIERGFCGACKSGNIELVLFFLNYPTASTIASASTSASANSISLESGMIEACRKNRKDVVRLLLQKGVNINSYEFENYLMCIGEYGDLNFIEEIATINNGTRNNFYILLGVSIGGYITLFDKFISMVDSLNVTEYMSMIYGAAENGHIDMILHIIKYTQSININLYNHKMWKSISTFLYKNYQYNLVDFVETFITAV
jgi:hypothetical protein